MYLHIPFNRWLQLSTGTADLAPGTHWSQELQVPKGARAGHPGVNSESIPPFHFIPG